MTTSNESHDMAVQLQALMTQHALTLSTAESCTSGRIAAILTSASGASEYYQGGLVAYQDALKVRHLGVKPETIAEHDVVSREVVEQMVRGCCQMFGTHYAIASTGYTGEGSQRVPRGTVWLAWGNVSEVHSLCLTADHGREHNTSTAASTAVRLFLEYIHERL